MNTAAWAALLVGLAVWWAQRTPAVPPAGSSTAESATDPLRLPKPARLSVTALAGLAMTLLVPGLGGAVVAVVAAAAMWWFSARLAHPDVARRRRRLAHQLPEALSLLASCLAAGSPTRTAIRLVAEVSPEETAAALDVVTSHILVGRSEEEAWRALAKDPLRAPVWGRPAVDLARNASSGAAVVEMLRAQARRARAERRGAIEKRARTVGVSSVLPLMVCFLPAFIMVGVVPIIAGLAGNFVP